MRIANSFSNGKSGNLTNCEEENRWNILRPPLMKILLLIAALFCFTGLYGADGWNKSIEPGIELIRAKKWTEAGAFFEKLFKSKDKTHAKELRYWLAYAVNGKIVVNHEKFLKRDFFKAMMIYVPDDISTCNGAMYMALPGDTVKLRPGTYNEFVALSEGVTLSGTDRDKCIVKPVMGSSSALVAFRSGNVSVENLTIDGSGHDSKVQCLPLVWKEKNGRIIVDASVLAKQIKVPEDSTLLSVNGIDPRYANFVVSCLKKGRTLSTEWLMKSGRREVIKITAPVLTNKKFPVGILGVQSQCRISNCIIKNQRAGIVAVGDKSSADVENNVISNCYQGVEILFGGAATVNNNILNKCTGGIIGLDEVNMVICGNKISEADHGIEVSDHSIAMISDNSCSKSGVGIVLSSFSSGIIVKNICNDNGSGISVEVQSTANLLENTCNENKGKNGYGILVNLSSKADIRKNICNNNLTGIGYQKHSRGNILNNTCNNNKDFGILLYKYSYGRVTGNVCNNNFAGIYFQDFSAGMIDQNKTIGNKIGINRVDSSEARVGENFTK